MQPICASSLDKTLVALLQETDLEIDFVRYNLVRKSTSFLKIGAMVAYSIFLFIFW